MKPVKVPGPQASRYNASIDKGFKKFKDGQREDAFDKICKRRYTLLYITAMGNVSMTVPETFVPPSRILQAMPPAPPAAPKQTMYLTVSSEYFGSNAIGILYSTVALAVIVCYTILF